MGRKTKRSAKRVDAQTTRFSRMPIRDAAPIPCVRTKLVYQDSAALAQYLADEKAWEEEKARWEEEKRHDAQQLALGRAIAAKAKRMSSIGTE